MNRAKNPSSTKNQIFIAVIALIIGQIFWGTSYLFSEYALKVFPPATLVSIRLFIAALILGIIALCTGKIVKIPWKTYRWFLLAAFCEPFVYFLCEAMALQRLSSMVTSVILSFIPLLTPLLTYYFLREKITVKSLVGIVISIVGVLMVIIEKGRFAVDFFGVVLLFVAMVAAVGYTLVIRMVPDEYNTLCVVFYMFCTALIFFIPTSLLTEWDEISTLVALPSKELCDALLAIVALAITASCVAFLFYSYGVRVIGPNKASVFNNIQPAVTALFAWLLFDTPMTWVKVVGIAVLIFGMFVAQKK
ncbi:MAG: DMT family transporter [Paludibacteraceae bacterium]|nr:DMT family transporter [Paludibacteraceae bacterium]